MHFIRVVMAIVWCVFASASIASEARVSLAFEATDHTADAETRTALIESGMAESVVMLINANFQLPASLAVVFGRDDGPLYDSELSEIVIPYRFLQETQQRFRAAGYAATGVSAEEAMLDALMHTLLHEFAHALVYLHQIPVVGKEEDAADGLATVLLINFFEDGPEIARSAADLFDLESEEIVEFAADDFWDEHSLDLQRYYSTLCYVYGSDPDRYADLPETLDFSPQRATLCIEEYETVSRSWFALLAPYMKQTNSLTQRSHP